MKPSLIHKLLASRKALRPAHIATTAHNEAAEGGCGVIGIACSEQIACKHLFQSLDQMRNRGNGKGGGIAAVGLVPEEFGVTPEILQRDYLLVVAYLDPDSRVEVERKYIDPVFKIDHMRLQPHILDWRSLPRLEVKPPEVIQYFVHVKPEVYAAFTAENDLQGLTRRQIEDEIVYQNTYRLNTEFYASTGETRAFVLSHGKNLLVIKIVGYADDVVRYYQLEDLHAHVWIGHHRYPTKGRVWHPGGAHPFIGLNEALVHNGDFANYVSITEYLKQRNIYPLFLTDTEVSVLVFDLLYRTYQYPLEYVIEALAPTTEGDFAQLPSEKQHIYRMIQAEHMHSSPDGPWFFLIAQSDTDQESGSPVYRLTGITDTSMLRPQVFALQQASPEGPAIGFAASEKQAIDAALSSLAAEDSRFWARADRYWNARGGSHTDGGAFMFSIYPSSTVLPEEDGLEMRTDQNVSARLICTDKFGVPVTVDTSRPPATIVLDGASETLTLPEGNNLFSWVVGHLPSWDYSQVKTFLRSLVDTAPEDTPRSRALQTLTALMDRRYPTGKLRRSSLLSLYDAALSRWVEAIARVPSANFVYDAIERPLQAPASGQQLVVVDARDFEPEGPHSLALELVRLRNLGYQHLVVVHTRGHRFIGNGFGPQSNDLRIDVYGSPGDYLASGIDGMEIYVHNNAQDQLAQIMKAGKLVVYGDVGQTFGYAAKGGEFYILGNAAGRPMINAVGKPRVVINGTCLDYLAESFMAGDPHNGGGFVVLNGVHLNDDGQLAELDTPYPGGNLFSLASGGAIYVRDPDRRLTPDQLNSGEFADLEARDWELIRPYLEENERLFGISLAALLTVDGEQHPPEAVYRKIIPAATRALQAEEAWVHAHR